MHKKFKHKKNIGLAPGTIVYTGNKTQTDTFIEAFFYDKEKYSEQQFTNIKACFNAKQTNTIAWININGLNNVKTIESIGKHYNLHPLILEDIANIHQRPKIEEYANCLFVVFKMLYYDSNQNLTVEHVSLVMGENYVLSFQEADGDVFENLRTRIRENKGIVRQNGADYLLYALMDAVVDNYFLIIETLGEKIEAIEDYLYTKPDNGLVQEIQSLKREALKIRRSIFPLREVVNKFEKANVNLVQANTLTYIQDLYDHTIQVIETVEIYRDMLWGLMDMYMSSVSNKMNEVMKVLTIISTIFIPLTFIAGIYGMNFEYMPELKQPNGYYYLWAIMVFIFIALVYYFKRKKWL